MDNKKRIKKYICYSCNFETDNRTDYARHCERQKHKEIITVVEALNDLMTQKNLCLQKAVEVRIEPISQDKDNNFSAY